MEKKTESGAPGRASVNFFEGKQKTLYLTALFLSLMLAAAGWALAFTLSPRGAAESDYTLNVIFIAVGIVGTLIFAVCVMTAKTRTSQWTADGAGVVYHTLGRKTLAFTWEEIREAGYLKIVNPRTREVSFYLYWAAEELSSRRNLVKGGVMEQPKKALGNYNCRKGTIILYAIDLYDPEKDPLVLFTEAHSPRPLKNKKILQMAAEAAEKERNGG